MLDPEQRSHAIERQTRAAIILAIVASIALTAGACFIAVERHHPHDFNRVGSVLVIISLALVAYQFLYETSAERRRDAIIHWLRSRDEMSIQFTDDQVGDTERRAAHLIHDLIWRSRRAIVIASVCIGAVGEIVHGFGDLIIEAVACHMLACLGVGGLE